MSPTNPLPEQASAGNSHPTSNSCTALDESTLEALLRGSLSDPQLETAVTHLEECAMCRARVDELAVATEEWAEIRDNLLPDFSESGEGTTGANTAALDERAASHGIIPLLSPTDDPYMLGRLGGYEIAGVIGAGGMGVVLKGFDRALNRFIAIKVLAPHLAANAAARRRFSREAQAAAAVVHDNVVAIHGVSEANGLPFLVMPYIRSQSLQTPDRRSWRTHGGGSLADRTPDCRRSGGRTRPRAGASRYQAGEYPGGRRGGATADHRLRTGACGR